MGSRALLVVAATAMIIAGGQLLGAAAVDNQMHQPSGEFGSLHPSPDYSFWGPQRAKGVIVWSHGTPSLGDCADRHPGRAPAFISRFNLDGWDILRFDRDPCSDQINQAIAQIAAALPQLQAAGYRRIVLAGQSRGAWHSLEALSVPGLAAYVSGIIGVSPAKHGTKLGYVTETGSYEWKVLLDHLAAPRVSIALIFFPDDPYIPDAPQRAAHATAALAQKGNQAVVIYEDQGAGIGHGGASNVRFTEKYTACLIRFVNAGERIGPCATGGMTAGR
jgi:hypothetical protein